MSYQTLIHEMAPTINPAGVEASMRLKYGTLSCLTRETFKVEIELATTCEAESTGFLERTAASHAMLNEFKRWAEVIKSETYVKERAICDKAAKYANRIMTRNKGNYLTAKQAKHKTYAACDNAMRGRVEQYEILTDLPDVIFAYIGKANCDGMGCDGTVGQTYQVTTFTGDSLGVATKGASWLIRSYIGNTMSQFYARIKGREYTGRGFGSGMCIRLKETAASKRARA